MDYMVRATAAEGQVRAFAATTRELVETARKAHDTSPVVTAALGRLLTGGAMMGIMMKGDKDILTVTADAKGRVKGYADQPQVLLHANEKGKLDVGTAVGRGTLQVIKDLGLKEPYVGHVELQTGEIGDDLTYYFTVSEQVPSAVGLGVLMNRDNTVRQAGGFILQLMPNASEETIAALELRLAAVDSVTALLDAGCTPEQLLERLLGGMGLEINDKVEAAFSCNCSKERVAKALISLGAGELQSLIADGEPVELGCQFCGEKYVFTVEELRELLTLAR